MHNIWTPHSISMESLWQMHIGPNQIHIAWAVNMCGVHETVFLRQTHLIITIEFYALVQLSSHMGCNIFGDLCGIQSSQVQLWMKGSHDAVFCSQRTHRPSMMHFAKSPFQAIPFFGAGTINLWSSLCYKPWWFYSFLHTFFETVCMHSNFHSSFFI